MPTTSTPSAEPQTERRFAVRQARLEKAWLWGPAVAALVVRLALYGAGAGWAMTPAELTAHRDAAEYHVLARAIVEDGDYRFDATDPLFAERRMLFDVEALRTPGYPVFIAAIYAVAGPRPGVPIGIQLLIEAATCLLLAWALRGALGYWGAGLAAFAYAVHPGAALFANLLYSEALFTLLMVAGFSACIAGMSSDGPGRRRGLLIASSGLLFGLAALVRPVLLFLPVAMAVYLLVVAGGRRPRALVVACIFTAAFALALLPWAARNEARHGEAALSTSGAFNLLALYAVPTEAAATGRDEAELLDLHLSRADSLARAHGPVVSDFDRAPFWRREATRAIARHPVSFLRAQAAGAARLFASTGRFYRPFVLGGTAQRPPIEEGPTGVMCWWVSQPASDITLDIWLLLYALVVYPLIAVGVVVTWRRSGQWGITLGLSAVLAIYLVVVTGTPGHSRFMAPIVPFLAPFAAVGAERILRRT